MTTCHERLAALALCLVDCGDALPYVRALMKTEQCDATLDLSKERAALGEHWSKSGRDVAELRGYDGIADRQALVAEPRGYDGIVDRQALVAKQFVAEHRVHDLRRLSTLLPADVWSEARARAPKQDDGGGGAGWLLLGLAFGAGCALGGGKTNIRYG